MTPQLFLDLDGVLADFDGYYERLFGARPDHNVVDPPGFWENIDSVATFFLDLPLMADALDLWHGCARWQPTILTGLPQSVYRVEEQKREWVKRYFGAGAKVICARSRDKRLYGAPGDVLVDDWDKYRSLWEEMGGTFVLHESAAETLKELEMLLS